MDDRRFDQLARALGGASTRRSALAALAGLLAGGAALEADAKRGRADRRRNRRSRCEPACAAGQTCVQGTCACADGGAICGDACCAPGQRCRDGACADPLPACLAFGATCKDTGRPCCDGLTCGSGQGGKGDIACYKPAGAACERTEECVYAAECVNGTCLDRQQFGPELPELPDESCEPNVAAGDTAGLLRALAEEGEARLAPGEYVFELEDGETAITLQPGMRIIGCRGSAATEDRSYVVRDWRIVCRGEDRKKWTCGAIVDGPGASGNATIFYRVDMVAQGTTQWTVSAGIFDDVTTRHGVALIDTTISCFNWGVLVTRDSRVGFLTDGLTLCKNEGTCGATNREGTFTVFVPLSRECETQTTACDCASSSSCVPNVAANDTADLLAKVAAGDAVLPPNSTYVFTIDGPGQSAIEVPSGRSAKVRACPGTDRSTVNIVCSQDSPTASYPGWKCIGFGGTSLTLENVTISSGTTGKGGGVSVFAHTDPRTVRVRNTAISGFRDGLGLWNLAATTLDCSDGTRICSNTNKNCVMYGDVDISGSCTGCEPANGTCPP